MFSSASASTRRPKAISQRACTRLERIPTTGIMATVATPPTVMASPAFVAV